MLDQEYYLQFEGFEDLVYTAKVTRVQKVDNEVLAVFLSLIHISCWGCRARPWC